MKVTDQNRNELKYLIKLLHVVGVRREASEAICNALENDAQLGEMVKYLEENGKKFIQTEAETREQTILKQVAKIVEG